MPYQLGQHVRRHNNRMAVRGALPLAAAAANAVYQRLPNMPNLPGRSEQKLVNLAIRAAHELKLLDNTFSHTLGLTYTQDLLNGMVQGTGAYNRTGRIVVPDYLEVNLIVQLGTANVNGDLVRFTIYYDKECRGVAAGQADVLNSNGSQEIAILSSLSSDNVPTRFKILYDEVITLNPNTIAAGAVNAHLVCRRFKIPLSTRTHYYNATTGTVADIDSGSIYLQACGFTGANFSSYAAYTRYAFRDV
jgi:hypothetical protein